MTYDQKVQAVINRLEGGYDSEQEWGESILKGIGIERHNDPIARLEWIAEHMVTFRPVFNSAEMEYIDGEGYGHKVTFLAKMDGADNMDLLIGCVELAMGQEEARKRDAERLERPRCSEDGVVVNTKSSFNQP